MSLVGKLTASRVIAATGRGASPEDAVEARIPGWKVFDDGDLLPFASYFVLDGFFDLFAVRLEVIFRAGRGIVVCSSAQNRPSQQRKQVSTWKRTYD